MSRKRDDNGTGPSGSTDETGDVRDRDEPQVTHDETAANLGFVRPPSAAVDEAQIPKFVDVAGSIGVTLGVVSIGLAIGGLLAGWLRIQPLGNIALVLSLASITIAMVLGMLFQMYAVDWSLRRD